VSEVFLARVFVSPKSTVSDPEGRTIQGALRQLGFDTVDTVRAGKFFQISLVEERREEAVEKIREMCEKLLSNPIIEEYSFEIEEVVPQTSSP
jgi:phosphoribosylformylglycinamidine synthase